MIIVRLQGGMGNQMFQYAFGRILSMKYNVPLKLDTTFLLHRIKFPQLLRPHFVFRTYDLDVFPVQATIAAPHDISWWNRPLLFGQVMLVIDAVLRKLALFKGWEKKFSFDPQLLEVGPDAYLVGFFQSPTYFASIRDVLLKELTPITPPSIEASGLLKKIQACNSVALHVRRSDIAAKSFHGSVDVSYYQKAIDTIAAVHPIDTVFVFSDDIAWCKENLSFGEDTVFVTDESSGVKGEWHLFLMRACKHFVIPNSTFSWWAAWLGEYPEKVVVAPKKWFGNKSLSTQDLLPETWKLL